MWIILAKVDMETSWIRLVPAAPELANVVADYYRRNREFLRDYEPGREEAFFTMAYQAALLEKEAQERKAGTSARFYIQPAREPERIIGMIGLNNIIRGAFQSAFLGYKLDSAYCN